MKKIINLLPTDRKKNLELKKINLLLIRNGFVLILALSVFLFFLTANLFVLNIYEKINQDQFESRKMNEAKIVAEQVRQELDNKYSETEDFLKFFDKNEGYLKYLEEINSSLPQGVYFKEIKINEEELIIDGWAENRDDLLNFENNLKEKDFFKQVEMPISNLTSQKNVNFEIIISLKNKV
jgi:Tfp pilus assembly protein PilN